ncbi:hypothetical protein ACLMJK_005712 [Lecanora helva]
MEWQREVDLRPGAPSPTLDADLQAQRLEEDGLVELHEADAAFWKWQMAEKDKAKKQKEQERQVAALRAAWEESRIIQKRKPPSASAERSQGQLGQRKVIDNGREDIIIVNDHVDHKLRAALHPQIPQSSNLTHNLAASDQLDETTVEDSMKYAKGTLSTGTSTLIDRLRFAKAQKRVKCYQIDPNLKSLTPEDEARLREQGSIEPTSFYSGHSKSTTLPGIDTPVQLSLASTDKDLLSDHNEMAKRQKSAMKEVDERDRKSKAPSTLSKGEMVGNSRGVPTSTKSDGDFCTQGSHAEESSKQSSSKDEQNLSPEGANPESQIKRHKKSYSSSEKKASRKRRCLELTEGGAKGTAETSKRKHNTTDGSSLQRHKKKRKKSHGKNDQTSDEPSVGAGESQTHSAPSNLPTPLSSQSSDRQQKSINGEAPTDTGPSLHTTSKQSRAMETTTMGRNDPSKISTIIPIRNQSHYNRIERKKKKKRHASVPATFDHNTEDTSLEPTATRSTLPVTPTRRVLQELSTNINIDRLSDVIAEKVGKRLQSSTAPRHPTPPVPEASTTQQALSPRSQYNQKRKAQRAALRQRQPELSPNVPEETRLTDLELIEVGKIDDHYSRHERAPYAFTRYGKLRSDYKRLRNFRTEDGAPAWTDEQTFRL